jgi:hypothetical protein
MRTLTAAALLNIGLHVVGLAVAFVGMRPGSVVVPLDDRMAYLAARPLAWTLGWGVWMLCALAFVAFVATLRPHVEKPDLAALAVILGAAGATIDLFCNVGQMVVLPDVAAWKPAQPALFVAWERWLGAGGAVVANGLYSIAVFMLSLGARGRYPAYVFALGCATAAAGFLMVAAGLTGHARLLELSVGPTIVSFVLWCAAVTWAPVNRAA